MWVLHGVSLRVATARVSATSLKPVVAGARKWTPHGAAIPGIGGRVGLLARQSNGMHRRVVQTRHEVTDSKLVAMMKGSMTNNPVGWWLFGCAGMVATTLTVGAAARLTRSGASMLYWTPRRAFSTRSDADWQNEFEIYQDFSRRHQRQPMTLEDFKHNFKFEYLHRLLGEATSLAFLGPLAYFYVKEKLPTSIHAHLAGVLALGAAQMYIGRKIVISNVAENRGRHPEEEPKFVASHGLTFHNMFSLANMALLLWAGLHVVVPASRAVKVRELTLSSALRDVGEFRKYFQYATMLFVGTATAGTIVAGIDAGKEFNTFPKMGQHWIPDGLFDHKPWLRNFYDNVALVQLDHRLLAVTTLGVYSYLYMLARKPHIWEHLPPESKKALNWTMVAVGGQVLGGITMLVNAVPTSLAMVHQSGAAAILGTSLWTLHTLRFAKPVGLAEAAKVASKVI